MITHPRKSFLRSGEASRSSKASTNFSKGGARHTAGLEKFGILKVSLLRTGVHSSNTGREDGLLAPITHPIIDCLRSGEASCSSRTTGNFTEGSAGDAPGV